MSHKESFNRAVKDDHLDDLSPSIGIIDSRLSLQLAQLSLRLLSGEKALARDWREQ